MSASSIIADTWKGALRDINDTVFQFTMDKPLPSDWAEANLILPDSTTPFPGPMSYDLTPYCREIVNHLHPSSPVRNVAVMKGSQSGLTTGVVIPGICYIISQCPDPILFTAADVNMAARTIAERLDPVIWASALNELIRPNVIKKGNNRTGDTKFSKEFAGGTLTAAGTSNPDTFRMYHARYGFPDDWDTAPRSAGKEGSPDKLIMNRQKSYGSDAKTVYISTPTTKGASNIEDQYLKGTQKHWHWPCPSCGLYVPVDWKIEQPDGSLAGMIYQVDSRNKLIKSSVHYRTPCCGHLVDYSDKYDLNLKGDWISTVDEPQEELFESYYLNDIFIPPGFDDWETIAKEWLQANPPGRPADVFKLIAFNNQRLGLPFEDLGTTPKSTDLMKNMNKCKPGIVPDVTAEEDGNGKIILITLSCDINGFMNQGNEDVRLDWEIVAHTENSVIYSIDHGSIGTHKRSHEKTKAEKANDDDRKKWTLTHNVENSVWPEFENIITKIYQSESENERDIHITAIDSGFGSNYVMQFVAAMQEKGLLVYAVKGKTEKNYRPVQRDSQPVKRSIERPKYLYNVEVNQIKDDLAANMTLRRGDDGSFPSGFMLFPESNDGKYLYDNYFSHFEGEKRVEVKEGDTTIGFRWDKKNSTAPNHFWDVRIYNMVAVSIYLDVVKQSDPTKYKNLTWEEFVLMILE